MEHFHRIISALWNDSTEVNKGLKDQAEGLKPCTSCSKSLVDCCSRTFEVPLQSHSALPAREQHEPGPGASLMALSVSSFIVSPAYQERLQSTQFQPTSCAGSKDVLLCVKAI